MKERIKQLIEEYKEAVVELIEAGNTAIDEGNEFETTKIGISIYNFEVFIEDLEELLEL